MISFENRFPLIMGIINLTPDSFSDGGQFESIDSGVDYALRLVDSGADIIDIGGESTRPGSDFVDLNTEIERVIPFIRKIRQINPNIKISLDTTKYEVALSALELGINYINDISGLRFEPRLAELSAKYEVPLILMHSRDNPKKMQQSPYYDNLWDELITELTTSINKAKSMGANKLIIDPGIGFGKRYEDNLNILNNIDKLYHFNLPILLGLSRKSFIGTIINETDPQKRDFATAIVHSLLLKFNIDIIRVHNVDLTIQLKKVFEIFN